MLLPLVICLLSFGFFFKRKKEKEKKRSPYEASNFEDAHASNSSNCPLISEHKVSIASR
jgi:hypothetical protein